MTAYGSVLTAGYSGDGLRAWKQNASARTYFLYDGIVPVVELDSTGAVTATNTFGASGLVSHREGSTSVIIRLIWLIPQAHTSPMTFKRPRLRK
jgi:hypothetical protein